MNEITVTQADQASEPASERDAILSLIERLARDPSIDPSRVERFIAMHEQTMARDASRAYLAAFARLQADLPSVAKRGQAHNGRKYARFEDVISAIREPMARHGFSLSFRTVLEGPVIRVIGILGHEAGHHEETELPLPADTSGSKNPVQAWGSSISYGKRYVALTLLGIATDDDDDGNGAARGPVISDQQADELRALLTGPGQSIDRFLSYMKVESLSDIPQSQFERAKAAIEAQTKKQLSAGGQQKEDSR